MSDWFTSNVTATALESPLPTQSSPVPVLTPVANVIPQSIESPPSRVVPSDHMRNCLYFICPKRGIQTWVDNVVLLLRYIQQFNGTVTICVAQGSDLVDVEHVKEMFYDLPGYLKINWMVVDNNYGLRESAYWLSMLETVENQPGITWYGHTKGITRISSVFQNPNPVAQWVEASYKTTLQFPHLVDNSLREFSTAGSFRRIGRYWQKYQSQSTWHYSGTFFWLKNDSLFNRNWKRIENHAWGLEAYPSTIFSIEESYCLFADTCSSLYRADVWGRLGRRLKRWEESHQAELNGEQND